MEMLLQMLADFVKFGIDLGHSLLERLEILVMFVLGGLVERVGGADTGHHVLSLGVDQPFSVELVVAGGGVAGERHAGGGGVAHVSEDHGLHVDGGAPVIGNLLNLAVGDGALAVP